MDGTLHADLGRATVVELPREETERRWQATTPQWPIMHAVLHGVTRDQMMARHKANHLNVVYAPTAADADKALAVKAAMFAAMGLRYTVRRREAVKKKKNRRDSSLTTPPDPYPSRVRRGGEKRGHYIWAFDESR